MAINGGRQLTDDEVDKFAYEIALGYYTDEELRQHFKLIPSSFDTWKSSSRVQSLLLVKRREIDESDAALKIHARRAMRKSIDEYIKIVEDKEAPAKTRMEAGRQLREIAAGVDKAALSDPTNTGERPVIIKTNLDLKGAKGVYVITAKEIEDQAEEAKILERERHGDNVMDEIASLIGEMPQV